MFEKERIFKNGTEISFKRGDKIFQRFEPVGKHAVFFIKTGFVKLTITKKSGEKLKLFLKEGDLFGIPEVYANSPRLTEALCESDTECYVWNKTNFFLTVSMVWELSIYCIKSLSYFLKILNEEFIEEKSIKL